VVTFAVAGIAVFLMVTALIIPRLGRFTVWEYEVQCYMIHILGDAWRDAGRRGTATTESKTDGNQ
jgi:hypothetical protein